MKGESLLREHLKAEEDLARERARAGILNFTVYTHLQWQSTNWHHRVFARAINYLYRRKTAREFLNSVGLHGKELERQLKTPHPVTGLYAGLTHPDAIDKPLRNLQGNLPPRHGKLLAHDTLVPTPHGMRRHGELRVGDQVFGSDGMPTRVVALGQEDNANYRVTFSHGLTVRCHGEHLWPVHEAGRTGLLFVRETQSLPGRGIMMADSKRGVPCLRARFTSPAPVSFCYPSRDLLIAPYVLGAWLGDGSENKACITHAPTDEEVIRAIEACGYTRGRAWAHKTTGVITTSFAPMGIKPGLPGCRLIQEIKTLGLFKNKHIPDDYLACSVTQRLELLAGLIDTDGHVAKKTGRVRFCNANKRLIDDVARLVRGLGFRASVSETQPPTDKTSGIIGKRVTYQVGFNPSILVPCRLPRKKNGRIIPAKRVGIVAIEKCPPVVGRCIQVEAADGCYWVGERPVLTHNSEMVSRRAPAWIFGQNPDAKIVAIACAAELSQTMNRDIQRIMTSEEYAALFPKTQLNGKNIRSTSQGSYIRNSDMFEIVDHQGVYKNAGVGGNIIGRAANYLFCDDLFSGRKEASSPTIRQAVWDFYQSDAETRLENDGAVVIINQRWHHDDVSGRMQATARANPEASQWLCLTYPAILDYEPGPGDPRKQGEALWPWRKTREQHLRTKAGISSMAWSSVWEQNPTPSEGGLVKDSWWQFYTELPAGVEPSLISVDLSFSNRGDYSVYTVWAEHKADRYLVDMVRGRLEFTEQVRAFQSLCQKYPRIRVKIVEEAANGAALINVLKGKIAGIIAIKPHNAKGLRADAVTPQIESGNVYLPAPSVSGWVKDVIKEWREFPRGTHDDIVDSMSQALTRMDKKRRAPTAGLPFGVPRESGHSPWLGR